MRMLTVAVGAIGALAAATTGVVMTRGEHAQTAPPASAMARSGVETVCVQTNVRLVEGMSRGCLTSAQFEALRDRAVIGGDGEPVEFAMAGPDASTATQQVRNCAEFDSLSKAGWYALSNADIRRAAYFERACGALSMLVSAKPARASHFVGGRASDADVRSMAGEASFGLGEATAVSAITEIDEGVWKLSSPVAESTVFEIAHADFNGDGFGEILAYISTGAAGGSARAGLIGFIEKADAAGPCVFKAR